MKQDILEFLQSPYRADVFAMANEGLEDVPSPASIVALRKKLPDFLALYAGTIVDIVLGTRRAKRLGKFREGWLFTNRMAEQATHPSIAAYHATAFKGVRTIIEVCTGAGIDTMALSSVSDTVISYESDYMVAALARGNFVASGVDNIQVIAQPWDPVMVSDIDSRDYAMWADPARRTEQGRVHNATQYEPSLSDLSGNGSAMIGIKVGPGDVLHPDMADAYHHEYIGFGSECRERILWKNVSKPGLSVSLIDKQITWSPSDHATAEVGDKQEYLIEPHNALIASGAVGKFIHEMGGKMVDEHIAYAWLEVRPALSPWYAAFHILHVEQGVSARRIQERIREYGWNRSTEFKKRGWQEDPERFKRGIKFTDSNESGVVIVARIGSSHTTIYGKRVRNSEF